MSRPVPALGGKHGATVAEGLTLALTHAEGGNDVCFVILRSPNNNIVCYKGKDAAAVTAHAEAGTGIEVFWIMQVRMWIPYYIF